MPDPNTPITPLIGNTVNPLTLENSDYKVPELPNTPIYKGPDTSVSKQDIDNIKNQPKTVFGDKIKGLVKKMDDAPKWAADLTPYGKVVSYDADYTGANFQRYYSHSKFQQLGFSPFRDNETLYNQKGNWTDEAGRMLRGWSSLFATGAMDGVKSWADNPFDPEPDNETARDMERKMSRMTSSKEGFGAGVVNFGANTAYSMGLVTEFIAESAALAAATAITFGADAPVTASVEAARAATLANKLGNMGKMVSNTYKTLTSLKDLNTAKNFFKSVNAGETLGKAMKFINPLEQTTAFIKETNKALKSGEQVYNMAKAAKGFGAFINDIRQTQMVMSEANLEGGSVENDMVKQLTDDFYRINGRMPNTSEAYDINNTAGIAGNKTIAWNMPALYLSNKIVFENAFKGYKPMRILAAENSEGLAGKLVFNQSWKKAGVNPWSVVEDGWKNNLKSLTKASTWAPKNLAKNLLVNGIGYTSKNLTEALQEQYQEAVSGSMNQYYTKIYQDPSKAGSDEMGSIFTDNLSKQFTTMQGFETFASGFFMGGVLQGPQKLVFEKVPQKIFQMKSPEQYAERKKQTQEWTDKVVESLNEVTKDPAAYFNTASENMVVQRSSNTSMREANENNDEKSFRDIADESTFNHLHTVINSGKYDLILGHLRDMKQLSPEELQDAFGPVPTKQDPQTYYNNKVDSLIRRAEDIKKRSDAVNEQFMNPFNPYKYSKTTENEAYIGEFIRYKAYEDAKKAAVYSQHTFDRTLSRMKDIITDVTNDIPISKANSTDFTLLFDSKALDNEINALDLEVKAFTGGGNAQQRQQAKLSQDKKEALEELRSNINHYRSGLKDNTSKNKSDERNRATTVQKGSKVRNVKDGSEGVVEKVVGKYAILKDGTKVNRKYLENKNKKVQPDHHLDEALDMFYSSYKNYLSTIANISKDHIFEDKVNDSFAKLKDYYGLEHDSDGLANSINLLHNPSSFIDYSKQMEEVRRSLYEKRTEHTKKALEEYMKIKDQNELLNKLLEDGVYIHPDDVKPLLDTKIIPEKLFDVINYEELQPSSEKYQKGLESITQWIEATSVPVEEETPTAEPVTPEGPVDVVPISEITKITNTTPLSDMPSDLVDDLIEAFRAENRSRVSNGEDLIGNYKPDNDNYTVRSLPGFKSYVTVFSKPRAIIAEFNTRTGRTVDQVVPEVKKEEPKVAQVSLIITNDMKQQLYDLGYSKEDVNKLRPAEANHLISGNITKPVKALTPEEDIERRRQKELEGYYGYGNVVKRLLSEHKPTLALSQLYFTGDNDIEITVDGKKYKIVKDGKYLAKNVIDESGNIVAKFTVTNGTSDVIEDRGLMNKKTFYDFISRIENDIPSEYRQKLIDEINTKYDAEIAALKQDPKALKTIEDIFKDATTLEEIEQAEEEVLATLANPEARRKINLTNEFLVNLIETRKRELLTAFTYEEIVPGNVLVMSDNSKMLVVEKSDTELKLRKFGDEGDNFTIVKKDVVPTTIKYKYKEGMEDLNINKPVTPEEKEISNQSVQNFTEFNEDDDAASVDEDMKKASSMSKEDRNDDLTNILGCKK